MRHELQSILGCCYNRLSALSQCLMGMDARIGCTDLGVQVFDEGQRVPLLLPVKGRAWRRKGRLIQGVIFCDVLSSRVCRHLVMLLPLSMSRLLH